MMYRISHNDMHPLRGFEAAVPYRIVPIHR